MIDRYDHPNLKITDIEIYPFDIKLREPFRLATMVFHTAQNVLLHILTNQGVRGWGEASPAHGETQAICIAAARDIKPRLLGRNPLEIAAIMNELDSLLPYNPATKCAFDMALFDITAKIAGMPLYRFLGGKMRPMETDFTIGLCPPEECGDKALEIVGKGFNIIKMKVGTTIRDDCGRIEAVRKSVGPDVRIRIDANQAWNRGTAVKALKGMAQFGIEFCEQPVRLEDLRGMRFVSKKVSIPIMADESLSSPADALQLIKETAVPYFDIKLSKSGGILNALKIGAISEAGGIKCMIGSMDESRLGLAASAHFACACESIQFFDLDTCLMHSEDPIDNGIVIEHGTISLPAGPGLGCAPSQEALNRIAKVD